MGSVHEVQCEIFYHISLSYFAIRNISDKTCREYQNTHFMFDTAFRKS